MPKYYGCPCEGCGRPLALTDDIVVCPDCGAPYHRSCYEKMGLCIHAPAHGAAAHGDGKLGLPLGGVDILQAHGALVCAVFIGNGAVQGLSLIHI